MRITVDGVPKEITTKPEREPERWNSDALRARGTNEASNSLNAFLDTIERKVHDARRVLLDKGTTITADELKAVLTRKTEKPHMLMEVFRQRNAQVAALVNTEYAHGDTWEVQHYPYAHRNFLAVEIWRGRHRGKELIV